MYSFDYDRDYWPPAPVLTVAVDGYSPHKTAIDVKALVDSGADGTMIPNHVLDMVGATYVDSVKMRGVTGTTEIRDRFRVRLKLGDLEINGIDAVSISHNDEAILGRDVLNQLLVILDGLALEVKVGQ